VRSDGKAASRPARRTPASHPGEAPGLFFAEQEGEAALNTGALTRRARKSWARAGLSPIGLHECRHTYAAFMIAAGVNAKALSVYMGHSSITVTLDRYGHLMPGHADEAAAMLGGYLERNGGG
jgi:integrase